MNINLEKIKINDKRVNESILSGERDRLDNLIFDNSLQRDNVLGCVKHWDIGIVSQAAYEPPTKANIELAKHNSQQRTHLPQIEVLMI